MKEITCKLCNWKFLGATTRKYCDNCIVNRYIEIRAINRKELKERKHKKFLERLKESE